MSFFAGVVQRPEQAPLAGASLFMLGCSEEHVGIVDALGGRRCSSLADATHCLVRPGLGLRAEADVLDALQAAKQASVPVVEAHWLQRIAGLSGEEHWSDVPIDSFVPPIMAEVGGRTGRTPRATTQGLSSSLDETWAFLMREHPEDIEEDELRRAIELSLLDCAITLRRSTMLPHDAQDQAIEASRRLLGVDAGATAAELRAAWRAKAKVAHPDKGGAPEAFDALLRAYHTLSRTLPGAQTQPVKATGQSSGRGWLEGGTMLALGWARPSQQQQQQSGAALAPTEQLLRHRTLVESICERHGADASELQLRQSHAAQSLGLETLDVGASNRNERGATLSNQCFYLSLACSYLGAEAAHSIRRGVGVGVAAGGWPWSTKGGAGGVSLLHETALHLKRVIEAAVLRSHPEWGGSRVGEEVQAFSDFLFFVLDSPTLLSELAIAVWDAESGFVEVYQGKYYEERSEEERRANLLTVRYIPGHYQALVGAPGLDTRPTLADLRACLEAHEVLYVITDG